MDMKQAAQVLDLLEFFGASGRPATLAEISKQLSWPKSSAHKLLATLSARGYLYEPHGRGSYYPSPRWRAVVDDISRSEPVPEELRTLLRTMAAKTGETAVLASISGLNALFIEAVESPNPVRYTAEVGKMVPLHVTAVGRSLLAQLPEADRRVLLNRVEFTRFTSATLMSVRDIEAAIAKGAKRGYFEGRGELNEDLGGVAMPLALSGDDDLPGRPLALMVAGPYYRISPRYQEIAKLLQQQFLALKRR